MKLSVIVPFYNAEETLALELDALAAQQWSQPWEWIWNLGRQAGRLRGMLLHGGVPV